MSERANEPLDWTDLYRKGQEQFLRRWSEMAGTGAAPDAASPFAAFSAGGLPDWGALFGGRGEGAGPELIRKYFALYDQYVGGARALWDEFAKAAAQPDPASRARQFAAGAGSLQQQFATMWSAMYTANGAMSAAQVPSFMNAGAADMPALGLNREHQESVQRVRRLLGEAAQQHSQLANLWNQVIGEALQLLSQRVAGIFSSAQQGITARALYDLWIESAEQAYAKMAHGTQYARSQAAYANTLAKLRTAQRQLVESWAKQLDLPTRAELNSLHRRIKELKAQLRELTVAPKRRKRGKP